MDILWSIFIIVLFFILFSICGWCCKRKREGTVYGFGPSLRVWTQAAPSASPVVVPPYPVDPVHGSHHTTVPVPAPAPPGFNQFSMPGTAPYGPPSTASYYYPPPMGASPMVAPYPPPPSASYGQPPPYHVAVSQPPQPTHEGYSKQSPYNPNYPQP